MSIDPMALVQETRPQSAMPLGRREPGALRRTRETFIESHDGTPIPVEQLDGRNPEVYKHRIPPPPCVKCGADHDPISTAKGKFDHEYVRELVPEAQTLPSPQLVPAPALLPIPSAPPTVLRRVSIFPGRGDDVYLLVVERREDDDWEDDYKAKLDRDVLVGILPILDALKVKIKDRTGGDLVELRGS